MKRAGIWLLIGVILAMGSLAACSQSGSAPGKMNCSLEEEVCIHIDTVERFPLDDPLTIKIEVTSTKDFSDLHVALHTLMGVTVDGPEYWESDLSSTFFRPGLATWNFEIKAGQTLNFERVLHFPSQEGWYTIQAEVVNTGRTIVGIDNFEVLLTKDGGEIYRAGMPRPSNVPIVLTVYAPGTLPPTDFYFTQPFPWEVTHEPATDTPLPPVKSDPTPTQPAILLATSTPNPYPYP